MDTTPSVTLTEFLQARFDEIEALARDALEGPWQVLDSIHRDPYVHQKGRGILSGGCVALASGEDYGAGNAAHIAQHDPVYVLADLEAKRRIIEKCVAISACPWWEYDDAPNLADDVLDQLASVYADHPDYREEWKP